MIRVEPARVCREKPATCTSGKPQEQKFVPPTHGAANLNAEAGSSELVAKSDSAAQLERWRGKNLRRGARQGLSPRKATARRAEGEPAMYEQFVVPLKEQGEVANYDAE
jgi:hypothetical protein